MLPEARYAEGHVFNQEPYSPDRTSNRLAQAADSHVFEPGYNKDSFSNTAWTLNGKLGDFHLVYTGAYMTRHIEDAAGLHQLFTRTGGGMYYQCVGSGTGMGQVASPYCYAPVSATGMTRYTKHAFDAGTACFQHR